MRRIGFGLALALVTGPAVGEPSAGEALFRQYCATCHKAEDLADRHFPPTADAEKVANDMCAFLIRHGRADEACDRAITDYLRGLAGRMR